MNFVSKTVLVWGKGESGNACAYLLKENQAIVFQVDKEDEQDFNFCQHFDFVLLSPGVPVIGNKNLENLVRSGAYIITETELGFLFSKSKILGITGTNGKTTTTSLLHAIMLQAKKNSFLCGNIGTPFSSIALKTTEKSFVCLELSSYQLEIVNDFHAHVACVLNIAPDHLTRHQTMSNYIKAKSNIFLNQTEDDFAVLNLDDIEVTNMKKYIKSNLIWFSGQKPCHGAYLENGTIYYFEDEIMPVSEIKLLGKKNIENVLAAVAIAKTQGIENEDIRMAVKQFEPLKHRIQTVATKYGITFVNDSKATNVASTMTALDALKDNLILLLGGSDKGEDFSLLAPHLKQNIKAVIVYGATKQRIKSGIESALEANRLLEESTLKSAFEKATQIAKSGDTILLSPACASFDEFKNFEHRGETFIRYVQLWREDEENFSL